MAQRSVGPVFMSYNRKDEAVMQRIVKYLRKQGINVWVDNEKLEPGTPIWEAEIEKAIKITSAVIVILSPDSKNSEWVRREITLADQYHTRIFPVLVRGDEEASITIRLITRQYVDLRQNEESGLNTLSSALSSHLEELETQEQRIREEAEKLAREKTVQEAAKEKAKRETAEKAAKEKAERKAAEKVTREKAEEAGALHYKGMLAQKEGKYDEAEQLFRQSLAIAIDLEDEQGQANIQHQLATLNQDRLASEKAEREAAERAAKEKAEREAAEKAAREKTEREAAERAAREKAKRETAEKAARKKAEREAAEKAAREKAEREAAEKAAREKAEREATEKVAEARTETTQTKLVKDTPFLFSGVGRFILGGVLGIFLFWFSFGTILTDEVFYFAIPCSLAGLIIYPHKWSIAILIFGFLIAGFASPAYFIETGVVFGVPAGALLSRILHWIKIIK